MCVSWAHIRVADGHTKLEKKIPLQTSRESHDKVGRGYGVRSKGTQLSRLPLALPRKVVAGKQEIFYRINRLGTNAYARARRPLVCI